MNFFRKEKFDIEIHLCAKLRCLIYIYGQQVIIELFPVEKIFHILTLLKKEALLAVNARLLEASFKKLFPSIDFKTDFSWAGTFAFTKDGLPFIDTVPESSHTYFTLGFDVNGTPFSVIAAEIIKDMLNGKINNDARIFSFNR